MIDERIPEGYILLARKIRKSPLWRSLKATHKVVMIEILLQAQFKDCEVVRNGEIIPLKRGQVATSYQQLVDDIGDKDITVKVVRNAINKLIKYGFLAKDETRAKAKKGLLLTVVNYDLYQTPENYKGKEAGRESDKEGAKQGQSKGKEGAINNNDNNDLNNDSNNDKENTYSRRKKYDEESVYMKLAKYFVEQIRKNNPNFKEPNYQRWANDIRLMMERDNRTEEQIRYLMWWVQQDDFEMANVLSPAKLRKRFDNLVMKVKAERKRRQKFSGKRVELLPDWYEQSQQQREEHLANTEEEMSPEEIERMKRELEERLQKYKTVN